MSFCKKHSYIWEFLIIVLFILYTNISKYIRHRCDVPYSECKGADHKAECVCKKDFKGNGTVECIPEGFSQEENGRCYDPYVGIFSYQRIVMFLHIVYHTII